MEPSDPAIAQRIPAHEKDLGGFTVGRVLPVARRRALGPFVFLDHMGPSEFAPGAGFDVRPHPHIGLSTLTFLFEGAIVHRDSLGVTQEIRPGEVNLMTAGRGVVHSERAPEPLRRNGGRLHGLQFWLALPGPLEDCEARFEHRDAHELPVHRAPGVTARVIGGSLGALTSPLTLPTSTRLLDVVMDDGGALTIPVWEGEERGVYPVEGAVTVDGEEAPGSHPRRARRGARGDGARAGPRAGLRAGRRTARRPPRDGLELRRDLPRPHRRGPRRLDRPSLPDRARRRGRVHPLPPGDQDTMIDCETETAGAFAQVIRVGEHTFRADVGPDLGGAGSAPGPHDLFDASLAACKTLTAHWYARRAGSRWSASRPTSSATTAASARGRTSCACASRSTDP